MATQAEIITKYAVPYRKARKETRGTALDEVVAVTVRIRDNARSRLGQTTKHPAGPYRTIVTRLRKF
ncbi:hypothetical protein BAURA86_02491 [Brevibacterium aurantiacum]|uniref:Uncharacterized protein n=1 Tax=Brevibacterium aurantiacum TaxID=273384 RepID=A0A2H1K7J1_BREAU|nr:hypothetical protein BAURA86_02491 [Brevibacterium aurantiacum]